MSLFSDQLKCPSEISDNGFDSFGCNTSEEGEVTPVSELDEHLGKMLLIEGDETNDTELVALLKNVMAQEKARDLETIKSQKEQITLLWNELKRNHDVIDKILEQNSLLNTIMYRDSRLMQIERQKEPVIASESKASVKNCDTVSKTTVTKAFNEDHRLLMVSNSLSAACYCCYKNQLLHRSSFAKVNNSTTAAFWLRFLLI